MAGEVLKPGYVGGGDIYVPASYNAWVYVNSNPSTLTDPSGLCLVSLPDDDSFACRDWQEYKQDEYRKTEEELQKRMQEEGTGRHDPSRKLPSGVHWNPAISVGVARIMGPHYGNPNIPSSDVVPPGTQNSQGTVGPNSCGVVALWVLTAGAGGHSTANDFYNYIKKNIINSVGEGLSSKQIIRLVNDNIPNWNADAYLTRYYYQWEITLEDYWYIYSPSISKQEGAFKFVKDILRSRNRIIAGVNIEISHGRLWNTNMYHWVGITGLTQEWGRGKPWQWIRIFNPYDNREEYYSAPYFYKNWRYKTGANREFIILSRK